MNTKLRQFFIFFIGLGVSIGLDQFTKHLAVVHLKGQKPFVLIKGVFEFYYSENRGAAFGMLQGRQGFFFLIAAAVILAVLWDTVMQFDAYGGSTDWQCCGRFTGCRQGNGICR